MRADKETVKKKQGPFDFLNSINAGRTKPPLTVDEGYVPFIVNRGLSYFSDTVLFANETNLRAGTMTSEMQYHYLRMAVRPRRRFSKWNKPVKKEKVVEVLQNVYNVSLERAIDYSQTLTDEQKKTLIKQYESSQGGEETK